MGTLASPAREGGDVQSLREALRHAISNPRERKETEMANAEAPVKEQTPAQEPQAQEAKVPNRLEVTVAEAKEAISLFEQHRGDFLSDALRTAIVSKAQQALTEFEPYGKAKERIEELTRSARHRRKEGPNEKVETTTLPFVAIPEVFVPVLQEIVTPGKRPHSCEFCQHEPTGGIVLDPERMKLAAEALESEQKSFPVRMAVMIGTGIEAGASPFVAPSSKRGGGGGGGGPRLSLEDTKGIAEGVQLKASYKGKEIVATVVKTEEGLRIKTPSGKLHKSISAAAQEYTHVNGWEFWSWDGMPTSSDDRAK